jgi:hypothetical protein
MGFSQIRHTTLVALLSGLFLPGAVQEFCLSLKERFKSNVSILPLGKSLAVLAMFVLVTISVSRGQLAWGLKPYEYPVEAADFVIENKLPQQLYNSYDWGGYLMWRLYPRHQVFIDGRSVSTEHFNASSQIDNRWDGWLKTLDKYNINTIVTRTCYYDTGEPMALIDGLAARRDWRLVFSNETALVYVRVLPETKAIIDQFALPGTAAYRTLFAEASRLYDEAPQSRSMALLGIGRAAIRLADWPAARSAYEEYLRRYPNHKESANAIRFLNRMGVS